MKRIVLRLTCFLTFIVLQLAVSPQPVRAEAKPKLFQGQRLPLGHPLAYFHLIYDPQIDVFYLNTQKIDIHLGGNMIEAIYIARQIRESYLDGRLQYRREKNLAYFRGKNAKRVHNRLHGLQNKSSDPAKTRAWNERNAEFMMPTNNKVASYTIVAPAPFQEPLSIDWKSYLPHCSAAIRHLYLCE